MYQDKGHHDFDKWLNFQQQQREKAEGDSYFWSKWKDWHTLWPKFVISFFFFYNYIKDKSDDSYVGWRP